MWKTQAIISGIIVLLLSILGFIIYQQQKLINELSQNSIELKKLKEGVTTPSIQTKTEKEVIREISNSFDMKSIQAELDKVNAELKGLQTLIASSRGRVVTETKSDSVILTPAPICKDNICQDPFGTISGIHSLKLNEPFSNKEIPIGEVSFSPGKEKPWSYKIYPRQYIVKNVISYDKDDNIGLVTSFKLKSNGIEYPIEVDTNNLSRVYPKESISFGIYPYIGLFAGGNFGEEFKMISGGSLGAHLIRYGKTKRVASFKFLGLGFGISSLGNVEGQILPINYNIGQHLPFTENLWVGPLLGLDSEKRATVAISLSVGL
jgi:hypothetical protein